MGSVIPGKIDPNYQGDLRYAEPIKGTAFTITDTKKVVPINTPTQKFQEQYYAPSWTATASAQAAQNQYASQRTEAIASGKLAGDTFTIRNDVDERQYNNLVAAQERARTMEIARQNRENVIAEQERQSAWFGIPHKIETVNDSLHHKALSGIGSAYGLNEQESQLTYDVFKQIESQSPFVGATPVPLPLKQYAFGIETGAFEKPATTGVSFLVGGAMGAGARALPAALEVTGAAKLIAGSPTATKTALGLSKAIPVGLGLLYAGDVGYRTYQQPEGMRARYLGEVTSTELVPLGIGGVKGYQVSDKLIGKTRWGDTSRIVTAGHIQGLPKEQQPAARATENIFRGIKGRESALKNEPDFTKIRNLGKIGPDVGTAVAKEPHAVFGRSTEIGQMPEPWIAERGMTSDLDVFTGAPSKTAERITGINPKALEVSKEHTGLVINKKTGQHAVDIHTFPENYPIGKASESAISRDIVNSVLDATPKNKNDLLFGDEFVQEKLYVQARRKAASVFGEAGKGYGPPEHRIKDVYDTLRYASYLGDDSMKADFVTMKRYWSDPKVYRQYKGGQEFGDAISRIEWGKAPVSKNLPKGGSQSIAGYKTPSGTSAMLSAFGISTLPFASSNLKSASRTPTPKPYSSSRMSDITSLSPFSDIPSDITPSKGSESPSPSPSPSPSLTPSPSPSPSPYPSLSPSFSPYPYPSPSPLPSSPVTPIFSPIPYLGQAGGYSMGKDRWGYVFGERLAMGDPSNDIFGMMMGGRRRTTKAKKKKAPVGKNMFGINFNAGQKAGRKKK